MDKKKKKMIQQKQNDLLREIREEAGLRQIDVAAKLKLPQSFVSKYETGEKKLEVSELYLLCQILEVSFEEFARRLVVKCKGARS